MYSIVLMAAVATGGPDAASFGHHKGGCYGGCSGYSYGCSGYGYGGCSGYGYGGCSGYSYGCGGGYSYGCCGGGGRGGLFHHKRSGYGCCGGYSAGCSGYSCFGSGYGYGGCCGGGFYPSYSYGGGGCYGGGGYYGGMTAPAYGVPAYGVPGTVYPGTVVPSTTTPAPAPGTTTPAPAPMPEKKTTGSGTSANLKFTLPAGSKLYVDGRLVGTDGTERAFYTPDLVPGQKYFYDVKAELAVGGRTVTEEKVVIVEAGANLTETFPKLMAAAAATTSVAGK